MQPEVTVLDQEHYTSLSLGFEGGESRTIFFFTEPETKEEARGQYEWRLIDGFMRACEEHGCNDTELCERCKWIRRFCWASAVASIVWIVWPEWGTILFFGIAVWVQYFTHRWIADTDNREARQRQRLWLRGVFKDLYPFWKANDFRGALGCALKLREYQI
jgi:hypothetical protein